MTMSESVAAVPSLPPRVDLKPWFLTLDDLSGRHFSSPDSPRPIAWNAFFGNDHPVELDVGCGRGLFLFNAAGNRPDVNFLGIELDFREGRRAARRLHKRRMPNARVLGGSVHDALDRYVPAASVSAIHVYFPDPWWKKKHRRRRVFTDQFADRMAKALRPGGMVHSWTDVEEYFGVISALMDHHPSFKTLPPPDEREPEHDMDYHTSFERKKRKDGWPIYRGRWQRIAD